MLLTRRPGPNLVLVVHFQPLAVGVPVTNPDFTIVPGASRLVPEWLQIVGFDILDISCEPGRFFCFFFFCVR